PGPGRSSFDGGRGGIDCSHWRRAAVNGTDAQPGWISRSICAFVAQPVDRLATGVRLAFPQVGTKLRGIIVADACLELALPGSGLLFVAEFVAKRGGVDFAGPQETGECSGPPVVPARGWARSGAGFES